MFIPLIKIVEFIIFTNKLYIFNKNLSRKKEKAAPKCRMEKNHFNSIPYFFSASVISLTDLTPMFRISSISLRV